MKNALYVAIVVLAVGIANAQAIPPGFTKITTTAATAVTYTDSTCANQTTCYYMVTAVDAQGHESPAAACSATQLCFGGNQAVAVMPSSGTHTVALSWIASTSTVTGYNVYRATGPLSASSLAAVVN
jgi:fibronectin type 3 domain-containing protein